MKYTKKQIKEALKNYGVKGYSRAVITSANWVVVGDYCGQINNDGMLYLAPINKNDFESKRFTIEF